MLGGNTRRQFLTFHDNQCGEGIDVCFNSLCCQGEDEKARRDRYLSSIANDIAIDVIS